MHRLDRHEVHALDLGAVHRERIDLPSVTSVPKRTPRICDARLEAHAAISDVPSLALDPHQPATLVECQVVPLLAPWDEDRLSQLTSAARMTASLVLPLLVGLAIICVLSRKWRSGSASPCEGEGRGFEFRLPLPSDGPSWRAPFFSAVYGSPPSRRSGGRPAGALAPR